MKITQEVVTVFADSSTGETNIILGGLRISVTPDEAALLASGLARSLEQLRNFARPETRPADVLVPPGTREEDSAHRVAPINSDSESMQLRTRALIQASIRDKGLSLREDGKP